MNMRQFVEKYHVECGKKLVCIDDIENFEKYLGVSFGCELTKYILDYGYLAYKHIELYGINSVQMLESDMIKQTKYLHEYFPITQEYIALENTGDGNYAIASPLDGVYEFSTTGNTIKYTGKKLFDYICDRFQTTDV